MAVILEILMTFSPIEITDLFKSHYSCYKCTKILYMLITTLKLKSFISATDLAF